jgi:YegS/Rv2252/BmrU family lipid kinase
MKVDVIINPASGGRLPVLSILNDTFRRGGVQWEAWITKQPGDAQRYAAEAVRAGADVVAACGGDGTLAEVAAALQGTEVPLGILPAGTGNVMAAELSIPRGLRRAVRLISDPREHRVKPIDMGRVNDQYFLLRASTGFEAAVAMLTKTWLKRYMGVMAYGVAAMRVLRKPPIAHYLITLESGRQIERSGLACLIANAGSIGRLNLHLSRTIDASDGLLDVMIVQKLLSYARLALWDPASRERPNVELRHWKAREVTIVADPPQPFQGDGDVWGHTPVNASVLPDALNVIVPVAS